MVGEMEERASGGSPWGKGGGRRCLSLPPMAHDQITHWRGFTIRLSARSNAFYSNALACSSNCFAAPGSVHARREHLLPLPVILIQG